MDKPPHNRTKQNSPLDTRLALEAKQLREQAEALPPGQQRDLLLRQARQTETAAHVTEWLSSPGLLPPT
jgi:hypothetical protein